MSRSLLTENEIESEVYEMETKEQRQLRKAAAEIISDFDTYGEVLQMDERGDYGPTTAIERLRAALTEARKTKPVDEVERLKTQVAILGDACEQACEWLEQSSKALTWSKRLFHAGCALGYLSTALLRAEGAGYKPTGADRKETKNESTTD